MNTLANYRTMARRRLDESTAIFYQDSDLTAWVNEAVEDICARAQIVQQANIDTVLINGIAGYPLFDDFLSLTRAEVTIAGATTPLYRISRRRADIRFGSGSVGVPQYYTIFGTPGQVTGSDKAVITVYPTPSAGGTLTLYYERIPAPLVADADTSIIPPGWDRLVTIYTVAQALVKNRDYNGSQQLQGQYEAGLKEMISNSRVWTSDIEFQDASGRKMGGIVQADQVVSPSTGR